MENLNSALLAACEAGDDDTVETLLQQGTSYEQGAGDS